MANKNISIILSERPEGRIIPGRTFKKVYGAIPHHSGVRDREILVEILCISLEPTMRRWLVDERSYMPPVPVGDIMRGPTLARVVFSRSELANEGDVIPTMSGWTKFAILGEQQFEPLRNFPTVQKASDMLSVIGPNGIAAWIGMIHLAKPQPGETVVISGAAGATGSAAGQMAKIMGARTIGICGSDAKCEWLRDDLGFDVALNYKSANFSQDFVDATDTYIDVYFDNVGGKILDACLGRAKERARFIECGLISHYDTNEPAVLSNIINITAMRIKMQGFVMFDHLDLFPQARAEIAQWVSEGRLKHRETIVRGGFDVVEDVFAGLFDGVNTGKLLVEV